MELKKVIDDWVTDKLSDPKVRQDVIDGWNASVNIPILNENTEEKIFAAIYDKAVGILEKALKK
jgi:hypothetical protein